jgi:hypothetical protein
MEPRPWIRDFAPVAASFALCPLVALTDGSAATPALDHARELADAERSIGVFAEPALHSWASGHETLMAVAGVAYVTLHVPVLIAALAWVYLAHARAFAPLRMLFLAAQGLTAAGWLLVPTAPPRLLGDPAFSDTLSGQWGASTAQGVAWLQSPYAAMPSGHVVFALIAGGAVLLIARHRAARVAGALYPVAVVLLTVITANHFWLDAVGAMAVVAAAGTVAFAVHRVPRPGRLAAPEPG